MGKTANERRAQHRYPLHLPIHYRVAASGSSSRKGTGTTCDISSSGLSFRCRKALPVGAHIEMMIEWPAKHVETDAVDLQATGFVLRSQGGRTAVRMNSRKLRLGDGSTAELIGAIA